MGFPLFHIPLENNLIIKRAQFNFVDVWDDTLPGWHHHTRVQVKKTPEGKKAFYISGVPLPTVKLNEIIKTF